MKVLLVGCGSVGSRHLANLVTIGIPLVDITIAEVPAFQPQTAPSIDATVVRRLDIWAPSEIGAFDFVIIATPVWHHAAWVRATIAAGVPFYCEKPAVTAVSDLAPSEWATSVPHVVGYQLRFHPAAALLKRAYPFGGEFWLACDVSAWPGRGYGPTLLECSHEIDLACWLLGRGELRYAARAGEAWTLRLGHPGQVQSVVRINPNAITYQRSWRVESMFGRVSVDYADPAVVQRHGYCEALAHALEVATGAVKSRSTLLEAKQVVAICQRAEAMGAAA